MLRRQPCCVDRRFRRTVVTFLLISHKPQVWSSNWIYRHRQKAHESSFPTIRLTNGNVVKFSHTNRKHFTVGDGDGEQNPQNLYFPLDYVDPHLMQQCLGPPHAPPQTAAPTVEALSHTYATKSPLDTMARPKCDRSANPTTCLIPGPVRPMMPNGIRIRSAVFPQCHNALDWPTDRPTHRSRESLTTIGLCAPRATRPNNNNQDDIYGAVVMAKRFARVHAVHMMNADQVAANPQPTWAVSPPVGC